MASPAVPDDSELMTGEAVGLDLRPTSFVLRGAGALLDVIVYLGVWIAGVLVVNSPALAGALDDAAVKAVTIASLVFCIVVLPDRRGAAHARQVARPAEWWVPASCATTAGRSGSGTRSSGRSPACSSCSCRSAGSRRCSDC